MGEEMDSPRGRIYLMKEELEENLALNEMTPYLYRSLFGMYGMCHSLSIRRRIW